MNYVIVFFLTGLWHGASFSFIAWGLYYTVFIIIDRIVGKEWMNTIPAFFRHLYSVIIILLGWVLFRAESLRKPVDYIYGMFLIFRKDIRNFMFVINKQYLFCIVIGVFLVVPYKRVYKIINDNIELGFCTELAALFTFIISIIFMVGSGYSPYLYFRFKPF